MYATFMQHDEQQVIKDNLVKERRKRSMAIDNQKKIPKQKQYKQVVMIRKSILNLNHVY